jgi:hypothetical protein
VTDYLFAKDGIFAGINLNTDEGPSTSRSSSCSTARSPGRTSSFTWRRGRGTTQADQEARASNTNAPITKEYLEAFDEAFRNFFHHYTEAPLLVVNSSDIDFVEHGSDLVDLINEIRSMRQGVQHYIPLGSR